VQFGVMAGQYAIWDALKKMSMWDVLVRRWRSARALKPSLFSSRFQRVKLVCRQLRVKFNKTMGACFYSL
jgi:hypothetical protein